MLDDLASLLLTGLAVSGVVFCLGAGWVLVDRLFQRTVLNGVESCDLPRHECGHCLMSAHCALHDDDEDT